MPFLPAEQDENGEWRFACPLLGADGRCTDYERRPQICRNYEPGQDGLCALHVENLEGLS
jgi:Fe-S-cluster containining protein